MKLNRLKSIVNQLIRESSRDYQAYMIDPFYYNIPESEIMIDLKTGTISPDMERDDVERYYTFIIDWFQKALAKEGVPIKIIDHAILKINSKGKDCLIKAQGREFKSSLKF